MFSNRFPKIVPFVRFVEKYGTARQPTDGNILRRMRLSCCILKVTNPHSEYVITYCFSTATMVTRKRLTYVLNTLLVLLYVLLVESYCAVSFRIV